MTIKGKRRKLIKFSITTTQEKTCLDKANMRLIKTMIKSKKVLKTTNLVHSSLIHKRITPR
jgi:hypothetical protein